MPLPVSKGSFRSPRARAGSRIVSCQSRSASMKSGSPSSTVTDEGSSRSVTIAAAYRCVTSARTRRPHVRNLCDTPRDGASGNDVACRGLRGRSCKRWLAIHAAAAVLRDVRPRGNDALRRGIQRRDRPRCVDDPRRIDLHRHQGRLRAVRDPRRGALLAGILGRTRRPRLDRADAGTLVRRLPHSIRITSTWTA